MSLLKQLSFAGGKVVTLSEDAVAYASGSGVCIVTLSTGAMVFHEARPEEYNKLQDANPAKNPAKNDEKNDEKNEKNAQEFLGGVSALASCGATSALAVAPRSLSPTVLVYDYPSRDLLYALRGGAVLDFADLAFSADGGRLAAVSKLPDFQVIVWDARTREVLCRARTPEPCNAVSFNPLRDDQLCTAGEKGLFMWNMKTTMNGTSMAASKLMIRAVDGEEEEDADSDMEGEDGEDFEEAQGPRNDFVCHCWNVHGNVHAATRSGEAYTVTGTGASAIEVFPAFYATSGAEAEAAGQVPDEDEARLVMRGIFVTKSHIVSVPSDGRVRWIAPSSFEVQRVVDLAAFSQRDGGGGGDASWVIPVTVAVSPGYLTLVVGTADGMMLSLPSANGDAGDAEDFDAEAFADAGADVVVSKLLDFHADSVYAVCTLKSEPSTLFTAAADGSVRLWDANQGTMLAKKMLSTQPFVCASSSKLVPLVALGTVDGMLRLVMAQRPSMEAQKPRGGGGEDGRPS